MRNNKGFTLAELLAIIALIAVFALIAGPNLTDQIKSSEKEEQDVLSQNIKNASMIYAGKYYAKELVNGNYDAVKFTLDALIQDGLLDLGNNECVAKKDEETNEEYNRANRYILFDGDFKFDEIKKLKKCYK